MNDCRTKYQSVLDFESSRFATRFATRQILIPKLALCSLVSFKQGSPLATYTFRKIFLRKNMKIYSRPYPHAIGLKTFIFKKKLYSFSRRLCFEFRYSSPVFFSNAMFAELSFQDYFLFAIFS